MKNISTFLLLVVVGLFLASTSSFAGGKKGKTVKTIIGDVLQIPRAAETPVIDGEIDDVWLNVTAHPMLKTEGRTEIPDTVMPYDDHSCVFRAMWDEDNFYLLVQVLDDSLKTDINTGSPWLNDCVELFFDGGNEKASSYDANDIQWRWVLGETVEDHPATGTAPGFWVWKNYDGGYNFELSIAKEDLATQFPLEADHEIGFEVSNGDLETAASPQLVLHWWTNNGLTWNNPSLFGTAVLIDKPVSSVLDIAYANDKPAIDGEMTEGEGWEQADEISMTRFEGAPTVYPQDSTYLNWKDHLASFWALWDEDYFYIYVKVIDDSLKYDLNTGSPWLNDCVEIFFDGGNEKASSYDANDIQWRWVLGETVASHPVTGTSPGEWMWGPTELGFDFEMRIAAADLATQFPLEADHEIGLEVSNGDLETAASPQRVLHWWTNNGLTWNNPSLFGTAVLKQDGVGVDDEPSLITEYRLEQNYPNPFNPTTQISYSIPNSEKVKLTVYNILGNEVAELVNETKNAGTHTVKFNAQNLASGVYFYRLTAGSSTVVKKMLLLK